MDKQAKAPGRATAVSKTYGATAPAPAPGKTSASQRDYAAGQAPSGRLAPGMISTAHLAHKLAAAADDSPRARAARDGVKFRLPTAAAIKSMLASKSVPEAKVKESIETALKRMKREKKNKLTTSDSVPEIMAKLFPKPGVFNEAEFKKLTANEDRDKVYKNVNEAETKLTKADQAKMLSVFGKALGLVGVAIADSHGLEQVFGKSNVAAARAIYLKSMIAMLGAVVDMEKMLSTDYNRDDPEIGLGGWANFQGKHVHLTRAVAQVDDEDDSIITIVHEFAHMADSSVDDNGYYGSSGFESMDEATKLQNAAHFEELPARYLGKSKYAGMTFKPGVAKGGGKVTFEDRVRRKASEYLRKAWDKAVDVHTWMRERRINIEAGKSDFAAHKARILEISRLEGLTIHDQSPPSTINMNDIVLCEGIARGMMAVQSLARKQTVPNKPAKGKSEEDYADEIIVKATAAYGVITGDAAKDKKLMDWLVKEYRKAF